MEKELKCVDFRTLTGGVTRQDVSGKGVRIGLREVGKLKWGVGFCAARCGEIINENVVVEATSTISF